MVSNQLLIHLGHIPHDPNAKTFSLFLDKIPTTKVSHKQNKLFSISPNSTQAAAEIRPDIDLSIRTRMVSYLSYLSINNNM